MLSFLLGGHPGVEVPGCVETLKFNLLKNCQPYPQQLPHFPFPPAVLGGSDYPPSWTLLAPVCLFDSGCPGGHEVLSLRF